MKSLPKMVLAALFAGLMVAGALVTIPFPGVPMIIANAFPWLAGLVLGPAWAAASTGLYLLLGAFGLPVFAKGGAGIQTLLGNTGGFLVGYLLAAVVTGGLRDPRGRNPFRAGLATLAGLVVVYLVGVPWLAFVAFHGPSGFETGHLVQAFFWATGPATFPFLFVIGDLVKAAAVVAVALAVRRLPGASGLFRK